MSTKTLSLYGMGEKENCCFIHGADAEKFYNLFPEKVRDGVMFDWNTNEIIGSTPIASACLNTLAKEYGARTPTLKDLSNPELMKYAKEWGEGDWYVDSRNLVVRSHTDRIFPKNNSLLKQIYELAEDKVGSIKGGFMIENFTFIPDENDKTGYGVKIVPLEDFKVVQRDKLINLSIKANWEPFSEVDDDGLPIFDPRGNRKWIARKEGLSRVFLDHNSSNIYSGDPNLAYTDIAGRLVVMK